jgi:antitoxin ParD1/3/4
MIPSPNEWQDLPNPAIPDILCPMTTMNISLPDDMKAFVDQQVRARGYMSASEYVRDLLRNEKEIAEFRAKIDEGYASPTPIDAFDDGFFAELRATIDNRG